jgi:hypothetical protein
VRINHDDAEIFPYPKEKREFRANILRQYRTNGYANYQLGVTDEEEESWVRSRFPLFSMGTRESLILQRGMLYNNAYK